MPPPVAAAGELRPDPRARLVAARPRARRGVAARAAPLLRGRRRCSPAPSALIDHHESPNLIEGSLDILADACEELGMRAPCCATARPSATAAATRRSAASPSAGASSARTAGLGCAASSACTRRSRCRTRRSARRASCAASCGTVLHVHVAEDGADVDDARERGYAGPLERLLALGALPPGSILAHGVHLSADEVARASDAGCWLVQNPRSNRKQPRRLSARRSRPRRASRSAPTAFPSDMRGRGARRSRRRRPRRGRAGCARSAAASTRAGRWRRRGSASPRRAPGRGRRRGARRPATSAAIEDSGAARRPRACWARW